MSKAIGIMIDGEATWHAPSAGLTDYATLCNIDPDDPSIGYTGHIQPPRGQRITCQHCKTIWTNVVAMRLRARDFD
ncbi:hypothetical protein [Acidovorax sp.]|uniref:hypothetical protein n=1 Tax=Acidovorax sp. TaxID=1872122 RepID=UPI00391EF1C3